MLRNPGYFAPFEIFSRLLPLPKEEAVSPHPLKAALTTASRAARLSKALRKRPIPKPKEKPEDFLGRYEKAARELHEEAQRFTQAQQLVLPRLV